jgi:small subunit ribosomal protein S7
MAKRASLRGQVKTFFSSLSCHEILLTYCMQNMFFILNHLRSSPAPNPNSNRPLLETFPPSTHLPLNPILYLTAAIDSVAPLMRLRSVKGQAGGGATLMVPTPLTVRQRRRTAFNWILDAASKKKSRGSGKFQFAQKVADEIIAVVEGRSSAWERRENLHRQGVSMRANMNFKRR